MAIIKKGNKILRKISEEVKLRDIKSVEIQAIIEKMKDELSQTPEGVAIAAPQIGINLRIFVVDKILTRFPSALSPSRNEEKNAGVKKGKEFLVFINPKIIKKSSKKILLNEGCLSVPNVYKNIKRSEKITIEAYDENGEKIKQSASKIFAQAIQHELDHLDGILFIDKTNQSAN
jgi:peptide deformylase